MKNNLVERAIHPAVIIRNNSYGTDSGEGAELQAIFMSIFLHPKKMWPQSVQEIQVALTDCLKTNQLPPLLTKVTEDGQRIP